MTKTLLASLPVVALLAACHDTKVIMPANPTLDISPDCADLTMTVAMEQPRPGLATAAVQRNEQAVIAALEKAGVAEKDLKLSMLNLYPVYDPGQVLRGYQASITITASASA